MTKLSKPLPSTTVSAISAALSTAIAYLAGLNFDLSEIDWSVALNWITVLVAGGAATGFVTSEKEKPSEDRRPLGIRNNNPGNLEPDKSKWLGATGVNGRFLTFSEPLYGLRAMARNLANQKRLHRIDNLSDLIYKYAPPIENDTESYIAFVSAKTAIDPNIYVDFEDKTVLLLMMRAMIKMENGENPYSDELIKRAIAIA